MKDKLQLLKEANDILRSVNSIIERKGKSTNWDAIEKKVKLALADHHKLLHKNGNISDVIGSSFVSACCEGEKCSVCGKDATHKLEETIFFDDPIQTRHPLTAYVCDEHFKMIVGS